MTWYRQRLPSGCRRSDNPRVQTSGRGTEQPSRYTPAILISCVLLMGSAGPGCSTAHPQLFPQAPPPLETPTVDRVATAPGDCAETIAMFDGDTATCRGLLVPFVDAQYSQDIEDLVLPTYQKLLEHERSWRMIDRSMAQTSYSDLYERSRSLRMEADGLRLAVPVVAVLGVLVGCAVGLAADDIAAVVP